MTKEARVECLFAYHLEDLGIMLVKGEVRWFDKATFDKSQSLQHAAKIKAVDVQWKNRAKAEREQSPPWLRRRGQGPNRVVPPPKPKRAPPPEPSEPSLDMEKIRAEAVATAKDAAVKAAAAAARSAVLEALSKQESAGGITQEQLEAALAKIAPAPAPEPVVAPTPPEMAALMGQLSTLMEKLQAQGTSAVPTAPVPVIKMEEDDEDEEEMFIPSGIVSSDSKAGIEIASSASSDDSLDAAAEALKKAAPKKRRSRRKKTSTGEK